MTVTATLFRPAVPEELESVRPSGFRGMAEGDT